jgi:hypothetical protein
MLTVILAALFSTQVYAASTTAASGFVASDGSVSFALNIPNDLVNDTSLYFELAGPSTSSWIVSLITPFMRPILIWVVCRYG